jgi:hypothetical protein
MSFEFSILNENPPNPPLAKGVWREFIWQGEDREYLAKRDFVAA